MVGRVPDPPPGPQEAQTLRCLLGLVLNQATLSIYFSIKIPLAGEKGISWRESGEEAMNKGEQPDLSWAGQGRVEALPRILGCSAVPFLATWSCQAFLASWSCPWSIPNHDAPAPEPSACSANPWRHSVPSYSVPLHATNQLLPPVCCLGGSGSVPTPSPRDKNGSCCSFPWNVQWHLIRP